MWGGVWEGSGVLERDPGLSPGVENGQEGPHPKNMWIAAMYPLLSQGHTTEGSPPFPPFQKSPPPPPPPKSAPKRGTAPPKVITPPQRKK